MYTVGGSDYAGTCLVAMPTTGAKSIPASLSLLTTILFRHVHTLDCITTIQCLYTIHGADHVLSEKDFVTSSSEEICLFRVTVVAIQHLVDRVEQDVRHELWFKL